MLRIASLVLSGLVIQSCAEPLSGTTRTYDNFIETAFQHAGTNTTDCGSGDDRDALIIACLQNSFDNNTPAVGIFWLGVRSVTALSISNENIVAEYNYPEAAPERGGNGASQRTSHFICVEPSPNLNASFVHGVFGCKERVSQDY